MKVAARQCLGKVAALSAVLAAFMPAVGIGCTSGSATRSSGGSGATGGTFATGGIGEATNTAGIGASTGTSGAGPGASGSGSSAGTGSDGAAGAANGGSGGSIRVADQPWPAPLSGPFKGQWIWQAADGPQNSWLAFRKTATVSSVPASVKATIAADTKYWLWINGQQVVFEGGLKRGPTPSDSFVDEVEIAPYLTSGSNTIAVLVWFFGRDGFSYKTSGKGAFYFEADAGGTPIVSDESWKVKVHSAYGPQIGPDGPNFRLPEFNVEYDARNDVGEWTATTFSDTSWKDAAPKGVPPTDPWGKLWPRGIPQWKNSGISHYVNQASLPSMGSGAVIRAQLPYNAQVTPYLRVNAPTAGAQIKLMTDLSVSEESVVAHYTTRAGEQSYESLGWMSGNEVQYTIPAGVQILELGYRETGYDADLAGSFKSNDSALNTLWAKAQRTLYLNMRDNYMDCPTRERALWWGDIVIDLEETAYALDRRADLLSRNAINAFLSWQRNNDHVLYAPVPGNWGQELPQQSLASIGVESFWTYYMQSADLAAITAAYPHVKSYLAIWKRDAKGLVVARPGGSLGNWADWGNNIDSPLLDNAWYYMALDGAARMAELLGEAADAASYRSIMSQLKPAFLAAFWNGTRLASAGYSGADDRGNGLAIVAGLLGPAEWPAVKAVLSKTTNASPYMEKYVLEAYFRMGDAQAGLERLRSRYAKMISSPISTLWERWSVGSGSTVNHAWSGGPLTLLSRYVVGVAPTKPGYEAFAVLPQLGDLTSAEAKVPSPRGVIPVSVSRSAAAYSINVTVPEATIATVGVPTAAFPGGTAATFSVAANGVQVFAAGKGMGAAPGVTFAGESGGYVTFAAAAGAWTFTATPMN
jgi:alpha-L-rhamnosidase